MKYFLILLLGVIVFACKSEIKKSVKKVKETSFYVGTYTKGKSQGIYKYTLQNNGKLVFDKLAAKSDNPSFLAKSNNHKFLLAVNENNTHDGSGAVESYLITKDSLKFLSRKSSGGADPCFLDVNKTGYVLTANYTGGNIGLHKLNSEGQLSELLDVEQHSGHGPTDRQKGPHAHMAVFNQDSNNIISVDLGTNQLWFSKLDTVQQKLEPTKPFKFDMDLGAGPRHLAIHPNKKWVYVINELNSTINLLYKNQSGAFTKEFKIKTIPKDFTKPNTSAEIKISSDGKFVYASNRGHNSLAIYKIDPLNGYLKLLAYQLTLGDGPRYFTLTPDQNYLLVANQYSNNLVCFKRDKTTGLLKFVDQTTIDSPVFILF